MSKQKDVITIDQINEDGTYTEVFQYRRSLRNCFRAFARILPGTSVSWVTRLRYSRTEMQISAIQFTLTNPQGI